MIPGVRDTLWCCFKCKSGYNAQEAFNSATNYTDYLELCLLIICEIASNGRMAPQAGFVWNVLERHVSLDECTLGKVPFKLWQLLCFAWQISASCSLAGRCANAPVWWQQINEKGAWKEKPESTWAVKCICTNVHLNTYRRTINLRLWLVSYNSCWIWITNWDVSKKKWLWK